MLRQGEALGKGDRLQLMAVVRKGEGHGNSDRVIEDKKLVLGPKVNEYF